MGLALKGHFGPYISNARRRLPRSLLVEDACTSPVSKKLRFSLRKPLHPLVCENACASSPTITLHILPIENRRILLPGTAGASCIRDVRCIPFRRDTPYRRRIRLAFPNQLAARLLPARAASETVDVRRVHVKQFVLRASKKICESTIAARVTSPKAARDRNSSQQRIPVSLDLRTGV
jgi:hypothetical protein